MFRILLSIVLLLVICLPVAANKDQNNTVCVYEDFHIAIKFDETVDLSKFTSGNKIAISVNEKSEIDGHKIFEKDAKGYGILVRDGDEWQMKTGELKDVFGNKYPVKITSFCMSDFEKDGSYIIPEGFVIDAFTTEKRMLKF